MISQHIRKVMTSNKTIWQEGETKILLVVLSVLITALFASMLMAKPDASKIIPIQYPPAVAVKESLDPSVSQSLLPERFRVRLQRNENLNSLFTRLSLRESEIANFLQALPLEERGKLSRLAIGTPIYIGLDENEKLTELIIMYDAIKGTRYYWKDKDNTAIAPYEAEYHKEYKYTGGSISSSLYQDGVNQGMSSRQILNFAEIFAYDIDFANDVRVGDSFSMMTEDLFVENRAVKENTITVAEFVNRGKNIVAIRYTNSKGEVGYFTPEGESMQSRFLRMPISLVRITSRFNPKRFHPVLKIVRPHNGVDFGARPGTPVFTTGNGRIEFIGTKGGYGKTVIVNHGDGYSTLYAHLRGFARGIRRGSRVKQGKVIGYVGNTGVSTGPHLHYEFRIRGKHRDPLKVKFARSIKLQKKELSNFLAYSEEIMTRYSKFKNGDGALVSTN